jgi:predicted kinase
LVLIWNPGGEPVARGAGRAIAPTPKKFPARRRADDVFLRVFVSAQALITCEALGSAVFVQTKQPQLQLVIVTGLPGAGKSTFAEYAGRLLLCPVFSKDWLEASLWRSGIGREANSGWAAYDLLTTLAENQLRIMQSAILDSVATFERIRSGWRFLAAQYGAAFRVVECVCSDRELLRRRLEVRNRGIPGWPELSWEEAESVGARYEPWQDDRLVLDTVHPLEENLNALHSYLL